MKVLYLWGDNEALMLRLQDFVQSPFTIINLIFSACCVTVFDVYGKNCSIADILRLASGLPNLGAHLWIFISGV